MTSALPLKELVVDVVELGSRRRKGAVACRIDQNIKFDLDILESFSSRKWQSTVYDALVVAAAVEFCDRSLARSSMNRSEENTSELQSLMRISYAVFCLKK